MYISLVNSLSSGFRKWSDAHQPDHHDLDQNDYEPEGATRVPIADPPVDYPTPIPMQPDHPWLVPGVGSSF
jgi:hypothetical protein